MARDTSISIAKGVAIILMVMGHTEGPWWVINFIYLFHMPLFFVTAGYFWSKRSLEQPWDYCRRHFQGLYVPMVTWSVVFLLLHNFWFQIGLRNEQWGNWEGGVTHPYTLHSALQRLVHIVFSMAGYDEFLLGAFWFFRALLVVSILFLVLYMVLQRPLKRLGDWSVAPAILLLAMGFAALKIGFNLKVTTIVQGGIRETWGILFFAFGVIYRRYESYIPKHWALSLVYLAILVTGTCLRWHGMVLTPKLQDVLTLPLTGIVGFMLTHNVSTWLSHRDWSVKRALAYVGDNTLYIFIFHILAFKIVTAIKIAYYGLDWGQMGTHMVVHEHSTDDAFFLLYTVVGVAVPLALARLKTRFSHYP